MNADTANAIKEYFGNDPFMRVKVEEASLKGARAVLSLGKAILAQRGHGLNASEESGLEAVAETLPMSRTWDLPLGRHLDAGPGFPGPASPYDNHP